MAAENAICSLGAGGLETFSLIAVSILGIGLFSVFGGKFFKKNRDIEEVEVNSLTWNFSNTWTRSNPRFCYIVILPTNPRKGSRWTMGSHASSPVQRLSTHISHTSGIFPLPLIKFEIILKRGLPNLD